MKAKNSKANRQAQMAVRCSALIGIVLIQSQKSPAHLSEIAVMAGRVTTPGNVPTKYAKHTKGSASICVHLR